MKREEWLKVPKTIEDQVKFFKKKLNDIGEHTDTFDWDNDISDLTFEIAVKLLTILEDSLRNGENHERPKHRTSDADND